MHETGAGARAAVYRTFFASLITANAGVSGNGPLKAAFAAIPRERFLGKGPWKVLARAGYLETPSDDPAFVYQDAAIALKAEANINNGQPTLHALCIAALNISEGETVTHVGAGTGYYTAILARLVGSAGSVHAFEIEPELAARAIDNLADATNVSVHQRSGSEGALPPSDVVYVSAGATGPQENWLDALRDGGRLLFPLTSDQGAGAMLLVKRRSSEAFDAQLLCPVLFIPCVGAREEYTGRRLSEVFQRGDLKSVQSLRRNVMPDETCWFAGRDWWLSTEKGERA